MNKQRAQEIAQAPDMKNVTYNGKNVYIQHVNEQNNTARVFPLDNPQQETEVQVTSLFEKS